MERHDSYEDRSSFDEDDHEEDASGNAMMSIFASYYGIEETEQTKRPPADLIDSAHFDSNAFVKVILYTSTCSICSQTWSSVREMQLHCSFLSTEHLR